MSIILFIVILFVLVLAHEFGHYVVAKRSGIKVEEFGIGYPPRAAKIFIRKGTLFTLNWLPFGGFVKIFGENPDDESIIGPDSERSFVHKPKYIQAFVLVAGVLMNFLVAWVLFSTTYITGAPAAIGNEPKGTTIQNAALTVTSVEKGSPAEEAGIKVGDIVKELSSGADEIVEPTPETLKDFVKAHGTEPITFSLTRAGEPVEVSAVPTTDIVPGTPIVGISMDIIGTLKLSVPRALIEGFKTTTFVTKEIVVNLYKLVHDAIFGKADLSTITGPVGIVGVVGDAYKFGFTYLLSLTALISLNLAVINLLPFPALDGGRLLFVGIEAIKGSRINPKIANTVNLVGFSLLIILMLFVTYHDILNLIRK